MHANPPNDRPGRSRQDELVWNIAEQFDIAGLKFQKELSQVLAFDADLMAIEVDGEFLASVHFLEMRVVPVHVGQYEALAGAELDAECAALVARECSPAHACSICWGRSIGDVLLYCHELMWIDRRGATFAAHCERHVVRRESASIVDLTLPTTFAAIDG